MKVQHITFKGSDIIRDTNGILPETIEHFKAFQIKSGAHKIFVKRTPFEVKLTITEYGSMFDILKNGQIAYSNACCFSEDQKEDVFLLCKHLASTLDNMRIMKVPDSHEFIYTFPINPFCLTAEENMVAGEIALYIYYSLKLAHDAKL